MVQVSSAISRESICRNVEVVVKDGYDRIHCCHFEVPFVMNYHVFNTRQFYHRTQEEALVERPNMSGFKGYNLGAMRAHEIEDLLPGMKICL